MGQTPCIKIRIKQNRRKVPTKKVFNLSHAFSKQISKQLSFGMITTNTAVELLRTTATCSTSFKHELFIPISMKRVFACM